MNEHEIWKQINDTRDRVIRVEERQKGMEKKIDHICIKQDDLQTTLTKAIKNGAVQNAVQNIKIGAWGWFIRIVVVSTMGAIITGIVTKIMHYW